MIFVLLYQCMAGFLAWLNYVLIKNNKRIYHALNGALHITAAVLIGYFTKWNYGLSCLLFTRVVFDTVLNVFRHRGVGYVSPAPASIVDKIESKLILFLVGIFYKKQTIISESNIEWTTIGFRIVILITGIILLWI